jgi:amidohydrolase
MSWQPLVAEYPPTLAVLCRQLRRQPGPAVKERDVAPLVAATLATLGFKTVSGTDGGVTGLLPGPGPAVAILTALGPPPGRRDDDPSPACGPDAGRDTGGGIAVALGAAMVLSDLPALPGAVKFVFQTAGQGDARRMIERGALCDPPVAAVFGFRLSDALGAGQVGLTYGQAAAATDDIRITILGRGTQSGPAVDAIVVAAQVVGALQAIVSRQLDPQGAVTLTVGTIKGGSAAGRVADRVELAGTAASLAESVRTGLPEKIERLVAGITAAHGASYRFVYSQGCPPLVNDARLTARLEESAARTVGRENILRLPPSPAGDDFANYTRTVPGTCCTLGSGPSRRWPPGRQAGGDACEEAIAAGVGVLVQTVLDHFA